MTIVESTDEIRCPACGELLALHSCPGATRLSELDQAASDSDQLVGDADQRSSDDDQRSANEDQRAADDDFAAGSDSWVHARTSAMRRQAACDRAAATQDRGTEASARLESSERRDRTAAERDPGGDAGNGRGRAAARTTAAADRRLAADDRELAARARSEAVALHAESAHPVAVVATDPLTGARTRAFGFQEVTRELTRARRKGAQLMLAFVDVDDLEQRNDEHGHAAGDAALRAVADALRAHLRPHDVIVRFGGDEFFCAMPDIGAPEARERFARIALALASTSSAPTISFGLAQSRVAETLDDVLARADAEMLGTRWHAAHG